MNANQDEFKTDENESNLDRDSKNRGPVQLPKRKFRLGRLALKELRETLRDRRTIVTLILMPLLVYPTLSLVFKTFLLSNVGLLGTGEPLVLQIAFAGEGDQDQLNETVRQFILGVDTLEQRAELQKQEELEKNEPKEDAEADTSDADSSQANALTQPGNQFAKFRDQKWLHIPPENEESVRQLVETRAVDVGLIVDTKDRNPWEVGKFTIVSRGDPVSLTAANFLSRKIEELNLFDIRRRLRGASLPPGYAIQVFDDKIGEAEAPPGFPLASLVPLVLILMTITGAVYPAIDLTAGERERGTLETLMAAPVPRFGILFSKFLAVWTVAVMTAVLNLIGMIATIWAFQLDKQFGSGAFDLITILQVLLLLVLYAAFFSSLLLAVTSFAKSFKEAQVYLIPIILLSLGPGLLALTPGMTLDGINTVAPMLNVILLARDVIEKQVEFVPAVIAVCSTLCYAYLSLLTAAKIFGSDGLLYAGQGSFAEMLERPAKVNRVVPVLATLFCLLMLFPINFASIGFIGRMSTEAEGAIELRFIMMGLFTFLAFVAFPWLVAWHQKTNVRSGFGLHMPRPIYLVAGILLGISLWPIVMFLVSSWHDVYGLIAGEAKRDEWHDRLVETTSDQVNRIRQLSPLLIAACLSIIPAVCEEFFFRGMLLRSLLKKNQVWKAVLFSAVLFGLFHVLSNSVIAIDRLIPTTLIGMMLGYLAYKSNSIIPGILLHALNNAIVVFLAYYQPQLSDNSWFPAEDERIPLLWVWVGLAVAIVGTLIVATAKRGVTNSKS